MSEQTVTGISVAARERIYEELARDEFVPRLERALIGVLERGFLFYAPSKPAERLQWYLDNTLAVDVPLLRDRDYLKERKLGLAPRLRAEEMADEARAAEEQAMQAEEQGLQSPQVELPPLFWTLMLPPAMPPAVFEWLQRDFIRLYERGT